MKITPEHYAYMKKEIQSVAGNIPLMRREIEAEGGSKDNEKRLRWDLSYLAGLSPWICKNIYPYADDTHIDTALKRILLEVS